MLTIYLIKLNSYFLVDIHVHHFASKTDMKQWYSMLLWHHNEIKYTDGRKNNEITNKFIKIIKENDICLNSHLNKWFLRNLTGSERLHLLTVSCVPPRLLIGDITSGILPGACTYTLLIGYELLNANEDVLRIFIPQAKTRYATFLK